uniref:Sulfotransferase domain-containing protein n=1 Tax=Haptolina ericina TaxID=156174 RepID=A0A7S3C4D2_9EUKA
MQHMLHLIKTGGDDVAFDDIDEVAPWIDFAWEVGQDLNADQSGGTRIFKSHGVLSRVHEGCKYVCIIRDPIKMLKSLYTFIYAKMIDHVSSPMCMSLLADVNVFYHSKGWKTGMLFSGGDSFFKHYVEFYKCRHCPTLSFLTFEDIQADLRGTIKQMCDFVGVSPTAALVDKVAERTSLEWMTEHSAKFDDHMLYERQVRLGRWGFQLNPPTSKVNLRPKSLEGKRNSELSDETIAGLRADWKRLVTPETGFETYEDMAAALRKERAVGALGRC